MPQISRHFEDKELVYAWFNAMHTRIDLLLWSNHHTCDELIQCIDAISRETARIEQMGSRFRPDSEVSRLNATKAGTWCNLSYELCRLLDDCIDYSKQTGGLFDITASLHSSGRNCTDKFETDIRSCRVRRHTEDVRIDLSGYLKGYALGHAVSLARQNGIQNGLLNFGNSSIYALGKHPEGGKWPIACHKHPERPYLLSNLCLTTSGNETEQRRHIIHPLTGEYITGEKEISVITRLPEEGEVMSIVQFIQTYSSIQTQTFDQHKQEQTLAFG